MRTTTFKLCIFFGLLFSSTIIVAQTDFREVTWGMDVPAVKSKEDSKPVAETKTRLEYDCSLADIKGSIFYNFTVTGQLMRGKYLLKPTYYNMNFYIQDFKMFEEILIQKYGKPSKKLVTVLADKPNITENDWPLLLSNGLLRVELTWNTPKTTVMLVLTRVGEKPAIQVDYISMELKDIDIKEKEKIISKGIK